MKITEFNDTTYNHPVAKFANVIDFYSAVRFFPTVCIDFVIVAKETKQPYLAKRRIEPGKNKYSFIGGRRYAYESLADSMKRILKTETGLDISYLSTPQFLSCSEVQSDLRHDIVFTYSLSIPQMVINTMLLSSEEYGDSFMTPYTPDITNFLDYHREVLKELGYPF